MRRRLVDEVLDVRAWQSVAARTSTSPVAGTWRDQGDGPEVPAPLVLAAVCEACAWLVLTSAGVPERTAVLGIESVAVLGVVRPGDVLDVVGTVEARSADTAVLSGWAGVDGRPVLEVRGVLCALFAAEQHQRPAPEQRRPKRWQRSGRSAVPGPGPVPVAVPVAA